MGVYIKGMEMPKVAGRMEAVITILKDGTAQIAISPADDEIGYWKEYPLIPVPTPHGRLIDADKIYDAVEQRYRISSGVEHRCERDLLDLICFAPTIIPAEEGD